MSSIDDERKKQRNYEGDVAYEVWRSGGNPDRIDSDRVNDRYYDGDSYEQTAASELRRMRSK